MKANQVEPTEEIQALNKLARKTRDVRMKTRYDTVRLYLQGRSLSEISAILAVGYHTVRNYIKAYIACGVEGLAIKKKSGRKRKLTAAQEARLYECISTKLPKEVGFKPFANWTASLACKWVLQEFGVKFSERGMRNLFDRLKLSYTRPTYVLKKANAQLQEDFKSAFETVKKN